MNYQLYFSITHSATSVIFRSHCMKIGLGEQHKQCVAMLTNVPPSRFEPLQLYDLVCIGSVSLALNDIVLLLNPSMAISRN